MEYLAKVELEAQSANGEMKLEASKQSSGLDFQLPPVTTATLASSFPVVMLAPLLSVHCFGRHRPSRKSYDLLVVIGFCDKHEVMELRHLRYFVGVARHLNYSEASRRLKVAQPAISQTILDLEDELGVKLLLRTKRRVQLTAAGAAFLREAEQILHHSYEAAQLARRAARGEVGSLGIGFFGAASSPFLPLLVQNYRGKFPDVQLRLYELTPDQQLAAFDDGRIDVGFSRKLPPDRRAEFEEENVYTDQLGLALCPIHRLAGQRIVRLKELASEQFVQFHRKGARTLFDEVIAVCRRARFSPTIISEPDFMATVLTLVEGGLCVSIVPSCVRSLKRPVLIKPIIPKSAQIPLSVTWRRSEESPAVMAFLEILRELKPAIRQQMEEHPWEEIRPIRLPNKSQPVKPLN